MSYCRWSNDDFHCDVYVYEEETVFMIHVASSRYQFKEPISAPVSPTKDGMNAWMARHRELSRMVGEADIVTIGLPHDGESFSFDTADECADELVRLKALGYNVPQYVIDQLREEREARDSWHRLFETMKDNQS